MTSLRLSFFFIFAAFLCLANCNPLLNLFGKSSDDKSEADDKTTVGTTSTVKPVGEEATTTTSNPSTSCGGLKGFLHICDKNEPAEPVEPPKSVKTRSVPEKDSDEDSDESKSDDDDDDDDESDESDESDEKSNAKEEKQNATQTTPVSEPTSESRIAKRQVGDPEAPILGDVPPVIADAMELPKDLVDNSEEDKELEKRQANDSDSSSDSDEDDTEENFRERRDCRDRDGDYFKDCRRKREFVPLCLGVNCKNNLTTKTNP